MAKHKDSEINPEKDNIRFVPTEAEELESRRNVEKIQKESRIFTRADFQVVLKSGTKPLKREQAEKQSEGT